MGWRNLLMDPLRSTDPNDMQTMMLELGSDNRRFRVWRSACIDDGTLEQRRGRYDTRHQVPEAKGGYPNDKWKRKLDFLSEVCTDSLDVCTSLADVAQL